MNRGKDKEMGVSSCSLDDSREGSTKGSGRNVEFWNMSLEELD